MIELSLLPLKNAVFLSHILLTPYVQQARTLVDMTCGNGHDTLFLAENMPDDATLYAFDIQEQAVMRTQKRLQEAGFSQRNICCQCGSHEKLITKIKNDLDIIVFNLGYLPTGNHEIHTKTEITVKAVKICLNKIAKNGIIMIAAYPGTSAGAEEEDALHAFLKEVPQEEFDVSFWQPINQMHQPPVLYIIQKRGKNK